MPCPLSIRLTTMHARTAARGDQPPQTDTQPLDQTPNTQQQQKNNNKNNQKGLLYAGSLWLSNSSYLYLSVSFIQMTKSLMPGLVYASGCIVGTERFSRAVAANMALIAFGVLVCAYGELNLVVKGLLEQLLALGFEAMRLTLVQVLINSKGLNMNPIQSLYYISPACFLGLLLPFIAVEYPRMAAATDWHVNASVLLANALSAFALNLVRFFSGCSGVVVVTLFVRCVHCALR